MTGEPRSRRLQIRATREWRWWGCALWLFAPPEVVDRVPRGSTEVLRYHPGIPEAETEFYGWVDANESEEVAPSVLLSDEAAEQLMDELWQAGYRPKSQPAHAQGQLEATERHLADMRKLAGMGD